MSPLRRLGLTPEAIDLPGHGESREPFTDLYGDADAVTAHLDQLDEPVLLVGHSYGGMVITDAGEHPAVGGLVYVTGFVPQAGETLSTAGRGQDGSVDPPSEIMKHAQKRDSMLVLEGDGVADALCADCDPDTRAWVLEKLGPQPTITFKQPARNLAWARRPSTYVVCTQDRTIPEPRQRRMAKRADRVFELESSHSPALSKPAELAALIAKAAGRA